jgi:hypothetical protein
MYGAKSTCKRLLSTRSELDQAQANPTGSRREAVMFSFSPCTSASSNMLQPARHICSHPKLNIPLRQRQTAAAPVMDVRRRTGQNTVGRNSSDWFIPPSNEKCDPCRILTSLAPDKCPHMNHPHAHPDTGVAWIHLSSKHTLIFHFSGCLGFLRALVSFALLKPLGGCAGCTFSFRRYTSHLPFEDADADADFVFLFLFPPPDLG